MAAVQMSSVVEDVILANIADVMKDQLICSPFFFIGCIGT